MRIWVNMIRRKKRIGRFWRGCKKELKFSFEHIMEYMDCFIIEYRTILMVIVISQ